MKSIPLFNNLMLELQSNCNRDCFFCNRPADDSGKRIKADGKPIIQSMPTEHAIRILDEVSSLGLKGSVVFHHMSETFLEPRIIEMALEAKKRGMRTHAHTNGDVLRRDEKLCKEAVEVFDKIVVGLYDAKSESDVAKEEQFWKQRLSGTEVDFTKLDSLIPRTLSSDSPLIAEKKVYLKGATAHYCD
jgi:MoaA/NifB/PqqE/SkfB family radical SAM enzyme